MKSLTLKYKKYNKSFVFDSVREAFEGNGKVEEDVVYFNDIGAMYKFLTPGRIELLSVIKTEKPQSLYELAQKMGKDQGYISKEVKFLKDMGVINLEAKKVDGRECLVPVLNFDRIIFDVGIDELTHLKKVSNQ